MKSTGIASSDFDDSKKKLAQPESGFGIVGVFAPLDLLGQRASAVNGTREAIRGLQ